MDELVKFYVDGSLAKSTLKLYDSGQKRYIDFCAKANASPLPLKENQGCRFVCYLASEGLKHTTIKCYLSAVRRLQIVGGLGDPFVASWPLLQYTLRGVKLNQSRNVKFRPKQRFPVTPKILRLLRKFWEAEKGSSDNIMLWAACCMLFFGFMRAGEVTVPSMQQYDSDSHLSVGDVMLDNLAAPSVVCVRIKASKTDPFRKGVLVHLGRTDNDLCPVGAVCAYLAARGSAYLAARGSTPGPFFKFSSGLPLSRELLVSKMRAALAPSGVDTSAYSGHSFRIGAASTAALVGIEDSLIKTLGRWQSSAYLLYMKIPREHLAVVSKKLSSA